MEEKNKVFTSILPLFRKDLVLFPGPNESDGSPTYSLYDPTRAQYFKISWAESLILRYLTPNMMIEDLCRDIQRGSTLNLTPEEITAFLNEAYLNKLLDVPRTSDQMVQEAEKARINPFKWLIFNYLYIRVPLLHPDKFLTDTLPYVRIFASRTAFFIYFLITFFGIYFLAMRWDEYLNTFTYFFNFEGILSYGLAVIAVKIIHELSHAYTAKAYNTRVPTIGVVFIVLWPALYTDVTDSWRLDNRKARLAISIAGVAAELVLAGLATFLWAFSEPGLLQSVFFIISSASWLTTLAVNINPALRFDGYYLLCDLWGIDNLQSRAFAITRWKLREVFLGMEMPPPEEGLSSRRILGMVVYSIYTWIYRVILYTTIAIFIYFQFTKALGIFLFILEIAIFLIWPIVSEFSELKSLRSFFTFNPRLGMTILGASLLFLWIALPLPHAKEFDAVVAPLKNQIVYAPWDGEIDAISIKRGEDVKANQILARIVSRKLLRDLNKALAEENILKKELSSLAINSNQQAFIKEKRDELASTTAKVQALTERKNELTLKADISGVVYDWDNNLRVGQFVEKGRILGKIGNLQHLKVMAFVPELWVDQINAGEKVRFIMNNTFEVFEGRVTKIGPTRERVLEYPTLGSVFQGNLAVQPDRNEKLILQEAYYVVEIEIESPHIPLRFGQTGHAEFIFSYHSYLMQWIRYFLNIFWREGGF